MIIDNRVPAGVPTGGEFATGARTENPDLDTGILNVGLMLNGTKLTPDDAEQALRFRGDDRALAIDLLMDQDEMVAERINKKPSEADAYALSTTAVRDAQGDMAEAQRIFTHRLRALSRQQAAAEAGERAYKELQVASHDQACAVVDIILSRYPSTRQIHLMRGVEGQKGWLVLGEGSFSTYFEAADRLGADDHLIDMDDPASLAPLCTGFNWQTGDAKGLEVDSLGRLDKAEIDFSAFVVTGKKESR